MIKLLESEKTCERELQWLPIGAKPLTHIELKEAKLKLQQQRRKEKEMEQRKEKQKEILCIVGCVLLSILAGIVEILIA